MSNDHQKFLEQLHETMVTSPEIIDDAILEAVGSPVATKERLVAGEVNEVWSATTQNGRNIIVRISHGAEPGFETEKWALDAVRQVGIPTPQVLLIKQVSDEGKSKAVCVETKLEGTPLSKISIDQHQQEAYAREIAGALEKIHSIKMEGFSYSHAGDRATPQSFSDYIKSSFKDEEKLQALAAQNNLPAGTIDQTIKVLTDHKPIYETVTLATLTHGDWGADHFLFQDGKLTGVIDMENAKGGDISYDLGWWDYYWRSKIPTEVIVSQLSSNAENLETLINIQGLRQSLQMLRYYADMRNASALELVTRNFDYYLNKFN